MPRLLTFYYTHTSGCLSAFSCLLKAHLSPVSYCLSSCFPISIILLLYLLFSSYLSKYIKERKKNPISTQANQNTSLRASSCHFSRVWLFVTPWSAAWQAPLAMGFSSQEYWSGLLWPPPGDPPDPGIQPTSLMSPALADGFLTTSATWEAQIPLHCHLNGILGDNKSKCICLIHHLYQEPIILIEFLRMSSCSWG